MILQRDRITIEQIEDYEYFADVCMTNPYYKRSRKLWLRVLKRLDATFFKCCVDGVPHGISFITNRGEGIYSLDGYRDEFMQASYKHVIIAGKLTVAYAFDVMKLKELFTENRQDMPQVNKLAKAIGFKNILQLEKKGVYLYLMGYYSEDYTTYRHHRT